jgi:hypothetical protein
MGAVMRHADLSAREQTLFSSAKLLRNALAHGHYGGWHAIERAREFSKLLSC